jgi:hypothetical protein
MHSGSKFRTADVADGSGVSVGCPWKLPLVDHRAGAGPPTGFTAKVRLVLQVQRPYEHEADERLVPAAAVARQLILTGSIQS